MNIQFICLANSFKEGGRCIAGIEILDNKLVLVNNTPKWIRPISENDHGEVNTNLVSHLKLLDIVQINTIKNVPSGYQSENVLFDTSSIKVVGKFPIASINSLNSVNVTTLFGNRTKVVDSTDILHLNYSLALVELLDFDVFEIKYEGNPNPKVRLRFTYNNNNYDLPITDISFLNAYKLNKSILKNSPKINIVLSLAVVHEGLYYKLVAGILF